MMAMAWVFGAVAFGLSALPRALCVCKWYVLSPHWILEQLAHPGHSHTP
jgi:hypothetical protein